MTLAQRDQSRSRFPRFFAYFALLALCAVAGGWNAWVLDGTVVVWSNARCVRYLMPSSFPTGSTQTQQFVSAMGDWSSIDRSAFRFLYAVLPQDYPTDHFDGYSDTLAVDPETLDPGVLAITYAVNSGATWYDMDMEFNDLPLGVGWNFYTQPSCIEEAVPGESGFVFKLVALHECGHSIGLAHEPTGSETPGDPWIVCTMNPNYAHGGSNGSARVLETHADDRVGARALYPAGTPGVVDLATLNFTWSDSYVGTAFTVHSSPSALLPGAELTVRSAIENRGSVDAFDVAQRIWLSTNSTVEASDLLLADLVWDLPAGQLMDFDLLTDLPEDLAAREWYVLTELDPFNQVAEQFEDNNDAIYCVPAQILRYPPEIVAPLGQYFGSAGAPWTSPTPQLTRPINMAPTVWSLVASPPAGIVINPQTGVISWANPVASQFQYMLFVRATNASGSDTEILYLAIAEAACSADINEDGTVNASDLSILLGYWGGSQAWVDLDHNGVVAASDLAILLSAWGPC